MIALFITRSTYLVIYVPLDMELMYSTHVVVYSKMSCIIKVGGKCNLDMPGSYHMFVTLLILMTFFYLPGISKQRRIKGHE